MDPESQAKASDTVEQSKDSNTSAKKAKRKRSKRKRKMGADEEWFKHIKKKKQLICKVCGKHLSDSSWFEKHQKLHLGIRDTVTCYECGKELKPSSLERHQKLHLREHDNSPKSISVKKIKRRKDGKNILEMD